MSIWGSLVTYHPVHHTEHPVISWAEFPGARSGSVGIQGVDYPPVPTGLTAGESSGFPLEIPADGSRFQLTGIWPLARDPLPNRSGGGTGYYGGLRSPRLFHGKDGDVKHARPDYNHIQDPTGKIPESEPVVLLRAQDKLAVFALETWCKRAEQSGVDPAFIGTMRAHIEEMMNWPVKKLPDAPSAEPDPTNSESGAQTPQPETVERASIHPGSAEFFRPWRG